MIELRSIRTYKEEGGIGIRSLHEVSQSLHIRLGISFMGGRNCSATSSFDSFRLT